MGKNGGGLPRAEETQKASYFKHLKKDDVALETDNAALERKRAALETEHRGT